MPGITFFITTIGKSTLNNTIRSLYGQMSWGNDKIKVFFDGMCLSDKSIFYETFDLFNNTYKGSLEFIYEPKNLGFWGHGLRNKYMSSFDTDYIACGDDDDIWADSVLPKIRTDISNNPNKLLLYKFRSINKNVIWNTREIKHGNIGTPSGLIPNKPEIFGEWGYFHGGDAQFYEQTANKIGNRNIVWKDTIIYLVRPDIYGYK